jgi:hypothetical protein
MCKAPIESGREECSGVVDILNSACDLPLEDLFARGHELVRERIAGAVAVKA